MFPTFRDLFHTLRSDDNSFYGFSKEELDMVSKWKSSRKVTSPTATRTSSSCTITSTCRLRLRTLKLVESQSEPLIVQQDSSGFHLVDKSFSKGSIPSVSSLSYSSSFITIDPGSGTIDTPTVTPTFGFQDRLQSQPVSSSIRQDGVQLQFNARRHDGFQLLSSRPSRQTDSGDCLERLEQVVKSIALRLCLFVDDNVLEQENQHGGHSQESENDSFLDDSVQEGQDSRRKRKGAASDQDEHKEDTGPPSKFRKVDGNNVGQPVNGDIIF